MLTPFSELTHSILTEPLLEPQEYILNGNQEVVAEIAVLKGPGNNLRLPPLTLFLRSSCMGDVEDPVTVTADVWNFEEDDGSKFILYTEPCLELEFGGALKQFQKFVVNADSNDQLNIPISNPRYTRFTTDDSNWAVFNPAYTHMNMAEMTRLERILLEYRKLSDVRFGPVAVESNNNNHNYLVWENATDVSGNALNLLSQTVDDESEGLAHGIWNVPSDDAIYEIRLKSYCAYVENAADRLNGYTSESITGIVDRSPPL